MNKVKAAAVLLALGALTYASVLTEAFLGYPLSPVHSYLSELSAIDQASAPLVRTMDAIAGVAFAVAGALLWHARRGLIPAGLVLAGVATTLDAAFPMDCAESQAACLAQLEAHTSMSHTIHAVTSSLAGTGLIIVAVGAFMGGAWLARVLSGIVIVSMALQLVVIALGQPVGIPQRVQVTASVLLMLVLAWQMKGGADVGHSSRSRAHAA